MFLAPHFKYRLPNNENKVKGKRRPFEGFEDVKKVLDRKNLFDRQNGKTVRQDFPLSWKTSFSSGDIIPTKNANCQCKSFDKTCDIYIAGTKQRKKYETVNNELKIGRPNENGHMLPDYMTNQRR